MPPRRRDDCFVLCAFDLQRERSQTILCAAICYWDLFDRALYREPVHCKLCRHTHGSANFSFIADPFQSQVEISNEERQLMARLANDKYNMRRDAFLPTFRRMDYLLMMENEEKYLVILRMSWIGTPIISVRRIDS